MVCLCFNCYELLDSFLPVLFQLLHNLLRTLLLLDNRIKRDYDITIFRVGHQNRLDDAIFHDLRFKIVVFHALDNSEQNCTETRYVTCTIKGTVLLMVLLFNMLIYKVISGADGCYFLHIFAIFTPKSDDCLGI